MDVTTGEFLAGLVWAIAMGLAMGNYSTTLIWRLPRHQPFYVNKPRCGDCGTTLKPYDLLPVVSWFLLRGKCRYCGTTIPKLHLWTELLMALVFALAYAEYDYSEEFILLIGISFFLITLAMTEISDGKLSVGLLAGTLFCGIIYRMLQDVSIYGFISGALAASLLAGALWQLRMHFTAQKSTFPNYGRLLIVAGACLHLFSFFTCMWIWALTWCGLKILYQQLKISRPVPLSPGFALGMIITQLYPFIADYTQKYIVFWTNTLTDIPF